MKNIIIGTAGHIDHGKTSLIKALTNIDTDSLEEEKKRGISINLGFAFFNLPSGIRVGVIDVPGHEKFIKNMLAGSTGVDIVLLVIACDEGIMPQTREHIDILSMLNIKKGIVVLTKRDLVDNEWYELIKNEIESELKDTFLKDAKMIPFSSKTKDGYDELVEEIENLIEHEEGKSSSGLFRMPIDRCFTVSGFGTVVTGTIMSGRVSVNESVYIYPVGIECKIRNLQVHEEDRNEAFAGQRCAINLTNVKKEDIERGFVVSKKDSITPSYMVDCKFYSVKNLDKIILNRQRIRFFHGASEIIGRIHILDKEEISGASEAYVQIHLEKPIVSLKNDRYVVRSYSPMVTIGGGYIINPLPSRVKKDKSEYLEYLRIQEKQVSDEYISLLFENDKDIILSIDDICKKYLLSEYMVTPLVNNLIDTSTIVEFRDGSNRYFIHKHNLDKLFDIIETILTEYHSRNKFKVGFLKEELRGKLRLNNVKSRIYDMILSYYKDKGFINLNNKYVSLSNFEIIIDKYTQDIIDNIVNEYRLHKFTPPKLKDLELKISSKDFMDIHEYLEESGVLYKVNPDMYLLKEDFEYGKEIIVNFIRDNGHIDLKDAKDVLNSNRKYIVFLLEHLDAIRITVRKDDKRVLF